MDKQISLFERDFLSGLKIILKAHSKCATSEEKFIKDRRKDPRRGYFRQGPSQGPAALGGPQSDSKYAQLEEKLSKIALIQDKAVDVRQAYEHLLIEIGFNRYPELRLKTLVQSADYFLRNGQIVQAALGYNGAYQFVMAHLPNQAESASKNLLKPIESYLKHIGKPLQSIKASWKQQRGSLKAIRKKYKGLKLTPHNILQVQREMSQRYNELAQPIVRSCVDLMGLSPCKYCFISLGLLVREEIYPYSDIECAILFEKSSPEIQRYFQQLARLIKTYYSIF